MSYISGGQVQGTSGFRARGQSLPDSHTSVCHGVLRYRERCGGSLGSPCANTLGFSLHTGTLEGYTHLACDTKDYNSQVGSGVGAGMESIAPEQGMTHAGTGGQGVKTATGLDPSSQRNGSTHQAFYGSPTWVQVPKDLGQLLLLSREHYQGARLDGGLQLESIWDAMTPAHALKF